MKYCPKCRSSYADETLRFCLQDGTELFQQTDSETEMPTIFFGDQTEQPSGQPATERFTTNKQLNQSGAGLPPTRLDNWEQSRETVIGSHQIPPPPVSGSNSSNTLTAVLATALGMLLLFGAVGIGAWFYLSPKNTEIADGNNTKRKGNIIDSNVNTGGKETPAPNASPQETPKDKTTPESTPTEKTPGETPVSGFDAETLKKEVSGRVYSWKSQAESRNLNSYMSFYADNLDYYNKSGASRDYVRGDKQRAFNKFDEINITISNMSVTPDAGGGNATAVFDKQWYFSNFNSTSEGKVRTQLKLSKIGGQWQITSERDLKIYYVK